MLDYEGKYGFGKKHERMIDWIEAHVEEAHAILLGWATSTPPGVINDAGGYGAAAERFSRLITLLEQATKRSEEPVPL